MENDRKKKIVLFIMLAIVCTLFSSCKTKMVEKEVGEFSMDLLWNQVPEPIEDYIPSEIWGEEIYLEKYSTPEEAAIYMEKIWVEECFRGRTDSVADYRPYIVSEDKENNLWLIECNKDHLKDACGGSTHSVVSKEDGKVIVMWGDE